MIRILGIAKETRKGKSLRFEDINVNPQTDRIQVRFAFASKGDADAFRSEFNRRTVSRATEYRAANEKEKKLAGKSMEQLEIDGEALEPIQDDVRPPKPDRDHKIIELNGPELELRVKVLLKGKGTEVERRLHAPSLDRLVLTATGFYATLRSGIGPDQKQYIEALNPEQQLQLCESIDNNFRYAIRKAKKEIKAQQDARDLLFTYDE